MAEPTDESGNGGNEAGGDASEMGASGRNAEGQAAMDSPEMRGSPTMGTAVISGTNFDNKSVVYYEVDGLAIVEGDICLGRVEDVQQTMDAARDAVSSDSERAMGVGIPGSQFRWPNCQIPYEIDPALPNKQRVTDAIAHWESHTAFRFPLRTAANAAQHPNYVRFTDAGGCWSLVGMQGGQQLISLGTGCSAGSAIHEIGHTVGLWHEQSREDRDLFVTIHWENIQSGMAAQFNQHITDGDDLGAYDYGSIMHYPRNAFSKNDNDTIVPTNPGAQIGQRTALSAGDIAAVRAMYPSCYRKQPWADGHFKKIIDDRRSFKKFRDDNRFKKIVDDIQTKPVGDPINIPGPGPVINPGTLRPFSLATPHHASLVSSGDIAAAMSSGDAESEADVADYLTQLGQQVLDLDAAIARANATVSQSHADIGRLQEARDLAAAAYEQAMSNINGGV